MNAGNTGNKEPRLVLITNAANEARPESQRGQVAHFGSAVEAVEAPGFRSDVTRVAEENAESPEPRHASPPPKGAVDDFDEESFFHEAQVHTPAAFAITEEIEVEPPRPSLKMTPMARARRQYFSKYVKGAMVAGAAILALAGIRVATGHADRGPDAYKTMATLSVAQAAPLAPAPVVAAAPDPAKLADLIPPPEPIAEKPVEPAVNAAPKVETKTEPAAPADLPLAKVDPKAEVKAPEPAKAEAAAPAPAASGKTALEEKNESRKLLERGKPAGAIEAGERSVALDPGDGEAWLILGAAYQEKGNLKDARRAFTSCLKDATRGPKSECKAMLQ